ncbi:uncharacterized protein LOC113338497 [Papaver somniferum]|uniref:uncharacterized protein LOC113338497 n=1 Tax=Papaver somniferum TaxID=3469 RepID=UPI000E6F87E1|nr:uncharacterized protein LOC113338497 [Papaver somniferum]
MGAILGQYHEGSGKEKAIYYISKTLSGYESKYTMLEKTCFALVWETQRLRHYMLTHKIQLLSRMDPIKYLFENLMLSGRMSKWKFLLSEFDITYITQKSVKGREIVDHLASHPILDNTELNIEFPDEWVMYADVTEEYESYIAGLKASIEINVKSIIVYGDSLLIIKQIQKEWRFNEQLSQYHTYLEDLTRQFDHIEFHHIYKNKNYGANALFVLASTLAVPEGKTVKPIEISWRDEPAFCYAIQIAAEQLDDTPWFVDIQRYLKDQSYPEDSTKQQRRYIRRVACQYTIFVNVLYKLSRDGTLLRCVNEHEARKILERVHSGECGPHMNAHMMSRNIACLGYYWTTMMSDYCNFIMRCHQCQIHGNLMHVPPSQLHTLSSP